MNFKKTLLSMFCALSLLCSGVYVNAEDPETQPQEPEMTEEAQETEVPEEAETQEPEVTAEAEVQEPEIVSETEAQETEPAAEIQSEEPEVTEESAVIEKELLNANGVSLGYSVHLSNVGWVKEVPAGTVSQEGRMEAIRINLSGISGSVIYQTHVQNIGWMNEVSTGTISGTTGRSYQAEAIKIRLSGEVSKQYDIWYRTKSANYGWLEWASNGDPAGSEGYSSAMRSIEIRLLPKGDTSLTKGRAFVKNPDVSIQAHVQNYGWMAAVKNGSIAGTTGQSLRMEALIVTLPKDLTALGNVEIDAHVQNIGWMNAVGSGAVIGTTGQSKRLEALRIRLTGKLAEQYDVNYRVHVQNIGWLGWAENGAAAGTSGYSLAVEAVQISITPKGTQSYDRNTPSAYEYTTIKYQANIRDVGWQNTKKSGMVAGTPGKTLDALAVTLPDEFTALGNIRVEAHVQNIGWMSPVASGEIAGTVKQGKQMEGIKLTLTGRLSNVCDIYYRVYVKGIGWLGWTRNGGMAGSEGCSRAIEAIQIDVVHKHTRTYPLSTAYTTAKWNSFTDVNSLLLLANKKHRLPVGYAPSDLTVPNVAMNYAGTTLRAEAAGALERMFAAARNAGVVLRLGSGFRSEEYQRTLYNGYVAQYGVAVADTISSRPGYSDHQTGLAADISDHDGRTYLTEAMENTAEGRWLRDHAHEYGFIMRYPKGKQAITGYAYEPWHFRYVGVDTATAIYNVDVWYTFEEYFGVEGGDYN